MRNAALAVLLVLATSLHAAPLQKAAFAAGCFWCAEAAFQDLPGVVDVVSGYTGGSVPHPTYEQVSAGGTGHREAVEITFDPAKITYGQLLDVFWRNIDPTDPAGQFCDKGQQYLAAIYVRDDAQRQLAELSLRNAKKRFGYVFTDILPAGPFYRAEEYHQDYYKKNPFRYHFYRAGCKRDERLKEVWGRR
ncbi:MAG: peptide-methionine (S)-S-oxide reductase MsrA [Acidobacteria bacterium]|nr:peptide-methionine (S)-S-oxide reductase MsrA [Acidobacteriota bacterium]MBV9070676.1 peptide-methionine (S)-S-oxide reductase MsrA [Acidobacteriota bacterium]MBV9478137.1 peptide-methionine (S)-S-oxide reductase MsrA [Acidobacteriota bacterium]